MGFFLFAALFLANGAAHSDLIISLKEIPEWAPGRPLEIRHIIIDGKGSGLVVVTNEDMAQPKVSQVSLFEYDANNFVHWADEYGEYKDFYGSDEDSDGRIVEGNPETVVLSFFNDGLLMKSIVLSGALAYSTEAGGQFYLPATVIGLRDELLAYAKRAKPQPKANYYAIAAPYSKNQKYWLLRSTKLESIPMIVDMIDERDMMFLDDLVGSAPVFMPLKEERFLRLTKDLRLSGDWLKGTFRTSEKSDAVVEIKFVVSE